MSSDGSKLIIINATYKAAPQYNCNAFKQCR